jgi:hypothetical protein
VAEPDIGRAREWQSERVTERESGRARQWQRERERGRVRVAE